MQPYRRYLIVACLLVLVGCSDNPPSMQSEGIPDPIKNSPLGNMPFSDWSEIDNVLRVSSDFSESPGFNSTSSVANALFMDRSNNFRPYAVNSILVDGLPLSNGSATLPNYFSPVEFPYKAGLSQIAWMITIGSTNFAITQLIPSVPATFNIQPMDTIFISKGISIIWNPTSGNDSLSARLGYNESMTQYYMPNASLVGPRRDAYLTKDDDGNVQFTSGMLNDFPNEGIAELNLVWYKFELNTSITNKKTLLISSNSYSIPVVIKP